MSDKAKRVMAVWMSLTPTERDEAIQLINEYEDADEKEKREIALESLNESRLLVRSATINFGPFGGKCPFCGK